MKDNTKKKNVKFYNVLFPVWLLFLFPMTWLIVIPGNFLIDTAVLLIALYVFKVKEIKTFYLKTILWVFLFGFLADILGGLVLLLTQFMGGDGWIYEFIVKPVAMNPFDNVYSFLYTLLAVIISGILIFVFNRFISFRKCNDKKLKTKIALVLAIVTAPYLFLFPTTALYGGTAESFTNHIVWDDYINAELYLESDLQTDVLAPDEEGRFDYVTVSAFRDAINSAEKIGKKQEGALKYTLIFYTTGENSTKMDKIEIFERNQKLFFEWKGKNYSILDEDVQNIYDRMNSLKEENKDIEIEN